MSTTLLFVKIPILSMYGTIRKAGTMYSITYFHGKA